MQIIFLTATSLDSSALYGGGAVLLGGASALLFIVALFGKRGKSSPEKLSELARITGPASAGQSAGAGAQRLEAPEETVVQIDEDDPRMAAAVAEAKKRLP